MIPCPTCRKQNKDSSRFCVFCTDPPMQLQDTCPVCEDLHLIGSRVCDRDGRPIAELLAERKAEQEASALTKIELERRIAIGKSLQKRGDKIYDSRMTPFCVIAFVTWLCLTHGSLFIDSSGYLFAFCCSLILVAQHVTVTLKYRKPGRIHRLYRRLFVHHVSKATGIPRELYDPGNRYKSEKLAVLGEYHEAQQTLLRSSNAPTEDELLRPAVSTPTNNSEILLHIHIDQTPS